MSETPLIKQFLRQQGRFMGYLMAMTRDLDAAEEIFQNVAVIILERAPRENIQDFHAWAKEIVRRQALHYMQTRSRQASRVRPAPPALLEGISLAFAEDRTDEEGVRTERRALQSCMERLPDKSRQMVFLRYQNRRSFEEIARLTHSTGVAVQRALSRVRKMLHDCVRLKTATEGRA